MPKKTSRSARVVQNQRIVRDPEKRRVDTATRPLTSSNTNSEIKVNPVEVDLKPTVTGQIESLPSTLPAPRVISVPATSQARVVRSGPVRRFAPARQPALSREEEFRFIRSDLRTVLILSVLMVVILVVLTILIGR